MRLHRASLASSLTLAALLPLALGGCDCEGTPPDGIGESCDSTSDCRAGLVCRDDVCVAPTDGSVPSDAFVPPGECEDAPARQCRNGRICCPEGEECVDDFTCAPVCENARCGDNNLTCCAAGQVCLDGVVCAADCPSDRALCGAAMDVCCDAGDVCAENACVTPGSTCGDDYDCLDAGTYCEPTIGRCLANPAPPLCEVRPDFDDVEIEVERHWDGVDVGGTLFGNVSGAPMVGDVSGDGVPDVVFAAYANADLDSAILVAIDGATAATHWTVTGTEGPRGHSSPALANLDPSDDALEIVYRTRTRGAGTGDLRVLDGDGVTELARLTTGSATTMGIVNPAIADMDHDGVVEIIAGCHVTSFEAMGSGWTLRTRFDGGACTGEQSSATSVVANLDADPELEVTSGGIAWNLDGTRLWPASGNLGHGFTAIADLDVNGTPEVIVVRAGTVLVRNGATGATLIGTGGTWHDGTIPIPGGGLGGAPTVADFDADGFPEVSAAGQGCYAVYDPDCITGLARGGNCTRPAEDPGTTCDDTPSAFLRWARPTQDLSSSITGSSVFDFQGDGVAEVVYNDECFLHVYDGRDGRELLATPRPNSSRTALEYLLVVDVDRDGNSEIVVPANNDQIGRDNCVARYVTALGVPDAASLPAEFRAGTHGIYVFGDPGDRWVRTRPIWNQYGYHVTNVDDRGAIPANEEDNWSVEGLNNYRQNVQGAGVFNAPNLVVTLDAVALCGSGEIRLSAVVTNAGSRGVPAGTPVEFFETAPTPRALGQITIGALLPGASERVTVTVSDVPYDTDLAYEVRVDGATTTSTPVAECNEDDNGASATDRCPGLG